jgi:hypothetical protein
MLKKSLIFGSIVTLITMLMFTGCPTEVEERIVYQPGPPGETIIEEGEDHYYPLQADIVVDTVSKLYDALHSDDYEVVAFIPDNGASQGAISLLNGVSTVSEVPADKKLVIYTTVSYVSNTVTAASAGLTVRGELVVGPGTVLVSTVGLPVSVASGGKITVSNYGTLDVDSGSIRDNVTLINLLGTPAVVIDGGTLAFSGTGFTNIEEVRTAFGYVTRGTLDLVNGVGGASTVEAYPSELAGIAGTYGRPTAVNRRYLIASTALADESDTFIVKAGQNLTSTNALAKVTTLTVEEDGIFTLTVGGLNNLTSLSVSGTFIAASATLNELLSLEVKGAGNVTLTAATLAKLKTLTLTNGAAAASITTSLGAGGLTLNQVESLTIGPYAVLDLTVSTATLGGLKDLTVDGSLLFENTANGLSAIETLVVNGNLSAVAATLTTLERLTIKGTVLLTAATLTDLIELTIDNGYVDPPGYSAVSLPAATLGSLTALTVTPLSGLAVPVGKFEALTELTVDGALVANYAVDPDAFLVLKELTVNGTFTALGADFATLEELTLNGIISFTAADYARLKTVTVTSGIFDGGIQGLSTVNEVIVGSASPEAGVTAVYTASSTRGALGENGAFKITVHPNGTAIVGTIGFLTKDSSVASGGVLTIAGVNNYVTVADKATPVASAEKYLNVSSGATINGVKFSSSNTVTDIALDALTLRGGTTLGRTVVDESVAIPANMILTIPAGGEFNISSEKVVTLGDGARVRLLAPDKDRGATIAGARITGAGILRAGATEISGGTGYWQAVNNIAEDQVAGIEDDIFIDILAASSVISSITALDVENNATPVTAAMVSLVGSGSATIYQQSIASNALTLNFLTLDVSQFGSLTLRGKTLATTGAQLILASSEAVIKGSGTGTNSVVNANIKSIGYITAATDITIGTSLVFRTHESATAAATTVLYTGSVFTDITGAAVTNTIVAIINGSDITFSKDTRITHTN